MISDEDVKQLFRDTWRIQSRHWDRSKPLCTQFYRGVGSHSWENQHPGNCQRHVSVYSKFKVIPRYCFECYKIVIEPRTVMELFKLMMVFDKIELPNDNTRKCIVERRKEVSGTYKGLIYCRGLEEGKEILKVIQAMMSEEISEKIPATLKRGCSEYARTYPEYAQVGQGAAAMEYQEEWQEYEDLVDRELVINTQLSLNDTYNSLVYTPQDAQVMLVWLKYAATIGDTSYRKICWALQPFPDLDRPSPFHPVEDE